MSQDERFHSYAYRDLVPLLEQQVVLVLDRELRVLALLTWTEQEVLVREQQQFTDQEFALLAVLLVQHPEYTPLADMLHVYSGQQIERCLQQINRALDEGDIDAVMRPVRNVLSRVRIKLHAFAIDVRSIVGTGYMLVPDRAVYRR